MAMHVLLKSRSFRPARSLFRTFAPLRLCVRFKKVRLVRMVSFPAALLRFLTAFLPLLAVLPPLSASAADSPKPAQLSPSETLRADIVKEIVSSKAYKATAGVTLGVLCNSRSNAIVPSNLLPRKNRVEKDGNNWRFIYEGTDCKLVYTYSPKTGTLDDWTVQVGDQRPFQPSAGGGLTGLIGGKNPGKEIALRGGKALSVGARAKHWLSLGSIAPGTKRSGFFGSTASSARRFGYMHATATLKTVSRPLRTCRLADSARSLRGRKSTCPICQAVCSLFARRECSLAAILTGSFPKPRNARRGRLPTNR